MMLTNACTLSQVSQYNESIDMTDHVQNPVILSQCDVYVMQYDSPILDVDFDERAAISVLL